MLEPVDAGRRASFWAELAARQLGEYLEGRRRRFTVPVDLSALSSFSRRVLAACSAIAFGEVRTYGWISEAAGLRRSAARAVGQALAANPVPVIVPCHRVIRADGALGGFRAGPEWKKLLLTLEARCAGREGM
ncbi:MAG: methylated-DNA--[protein]-cysteine S-methyltransferase [Armatimonadetes bacterium]|nr:methylated-DNA--[protein]-cysteine S-methyltransferase [Armatimonadota bacterium]